MRTKISKGKLIKILKKTPEVPNKGLSSIKNKDTSHKDWLKGYWAWKKTQGDSNGKR